MEKKMRGADCVLTNANVITMNPAHPRAQAVAVWCGRILFVGNTSEAKQFVGEKTAELDLKGKTVIPGFNEAHNHLINYGLKLNQVDLKYPDVKSIKDIQERLHRKSREEKAESWILGGGYDNNNLIENRHPTCQELDAASPKNPVVIDHSSLHMCVANSRAMKLAGISRSTPDPDGGKIVRTDGGEPTGLLQETAQTIVKSVIPKPTVMQMRKAIASANSKYLEQGITSSQDAWLGLNSDVEMRAYQEAAENGELKVRTSVMPDARLLIQSNFSLGFGLRGNFGNEMLKIGPLKLFVDGSLIGKTAAVYEPYLNDPNNTGMLVIEEKELARMIDEGHQQGWQLAMHAVGDRAIHTAILMVESSLRSHPRENHRHRIEHCGLLNDQILQKIRQLNMVVIAQPRFIYELADGFRKVLGRNCAQRMLRLRSLLNSGIAVAFGSDRPVADGSPMLGIWHAVEQKTIQGEEHNYGEAITAEEALRAYTIGGAFSSFEENVKGSIEEGKYADMAVLDQDPTNCPAAEIKHIRVLATMVGGRILYDALKT